MKHKPKAGEQAAVIFEPEAFRFLALSGRMPLVRLACFDRQAAVNAFACSYRRDCERGQVSLAAEMLSRGYAAELLLLYRAAGGKNTALAAGRREALRILRLENIEPYQRLLKRKKRLTFMEKEFKTALDAGDLPGARKLSRCVMKGFRQDLIRVGRMKPVKASGQCPLWALYCGAGIAWLYIQKAFKRSERKIRDMLFPRGALKRRFLEIFEAERDL